MVMTEKWSSWVGKIAEDLNSDPQYQVKSGTSVVCAYDPNASEAEVIGSLGLPKQ